MRIAFITDLHIDVSFEFPFGIDTKKNFQRLLKATLKVNPDLLVLGGDVCYRAPEVEIYNWLVEEMASYPIPFECIAGNHDNSTWLAQALKKEALLQKEEFYFARKIDQHLSLYLDTQKGSISQEQFNWLSRQLYQHKKEAMIFMHHPPVRFGVPYMDDTHAFDGGEQLMELLHKHEQPIQIFTGHYHLEKTMVVNNVSIFITPSCFFQLDGYRKEFKVDHHRVAFRVIDVEKGAVSTMVHYLAGSRS